MSAVSAGSEIQLTELGHFLSRVNICRTHMRNDDACYQSHSSGIQVDVQFLALTRRWSGPILGSPVMTSNPAPKISPCSRASARSSELITGPYTSAILSGECELTLAPLTRTADFFIFFRKSMLTRSVVDGFKSHRTTKISASFAN